MPMTKTSTYCLTPTVWYSEKDKTSTETVTHKVSGCPGLKVGGLCTRDKDGFPGSESTLCDTVKMLSICPNL